eukprot:1159386-Pelagomonas_calceolata.AAC.6
MVHRAPPEPHPGVLSMANQTLAPNKQPLAHPDFHQADHLRSRVDEQIMRDGVWGIGVGAAVVGVGLAVLFGSRR